MKGIIDRFEGKYVIVELDGGKIINIDKIRLPLGVKEGMVIQIGERITVNIEETNKRKEKIEKLTQILWNDSNF